MDLTIRPRRLRGSDTLRRMVRETRVDTASLIYPMFVMDGENKVEEISALPGQYRYTVDRMGEELERLEQAGVKNVMFFGIPAVKDEIGSQAYSADGIVQRALRTAKRDFPCLFLITDVCMCEYTSHGHCGILCGCDVDNDKTLDLLSMTALSHVEAGADMVAPSDMMDGRVRAIRQTLDAAGHTGIPIMSYAVKYASEEDTIELSLNQEGHTVRLVSENGLTEPLSPENLKHLFEICMHEICELLGCFQHNRLMMHHRSVRGQSDTVFFHEALST